MLRHLMLKVITKIHKIDRSQVRHRRSWSIALVIISGALVSMVTSPLSALVSVGVLWAHEWGHFFAGRFVGAEPSWPFVLCLGLWIIGRTPVRDVPVHQVPFVALAGPIVGIVCSWMLIECALAFSLVALMKLSVLVMVGEIFAATWGSDGRLARKYLLYNAR